MSIRWVEKNNLLDWHNSVPYTANRFKEGTIVLDSCSGKKVQVKDGAVTIDTPYDVFLLEESTAG